MLASANDVALQLAEHIGGSVDGFVQMMNARAAELGCTNTVLPTQPVFRMRISIQRHTIWR